MSDYTVKVKKYDASDPRLGRHVRHDSRSLRFRVDAEEIASLSSVAHETHIPTLDQGQLGSCTGNASTKAIGTGILWTEPVQHVLSETDEGLDEKYAVAVYSAATRLDNYSGTYPPTDTGSDGLSVAKVLQSAGLISGYQWATSLEALLTALARQPVIVGTEWTGDMFSPSSDGQLHITGSVEGGHEYCLDELDVDNKRVWIHNSWGETWGLNGRAWLTWDDMEELLHRQGDCTVFTPATEPAPQPGPAPEPVDEQAAFIAQAQQWLSHRHTYPMNKEFAAEVHQYLAWLDQQ